MKLRTCLTISAVIWPVASCGLLDVKIENIGNFCDVARPHYYVSAEVADYLAENDPSLVEADAAHNLYGERRCGWKFVP